MVAQRRGGFVLGTAQLGSSYGINNNAGRPTYARACAVMDAAARCGVKLLDTAEAYGESERLIGDYRRERGDVFTLCTKLPYVPGSPPEGWAPFVRRKIQASCERLFIPNIYLYYLHSFSMYADKELMGALRDEKESGAVRHVGVSVYEPDELRAIVEDGDLVDFVQIPLNVFNCSQWVRCGLLGKAVESGIHLLARSVFLQGVLFMDKDDPRLAELNLDSAVVEFARLSEEADMTKEELACAFVCSTPEIDRVVLGSETPDQVEKNAKLVETDSLDEGLYMEIVKMSGALNQPALDPRTWTRRGSYT